MEDHVSPEGKEVSCCTPPGAQLEEPTSVDGGMKKSASEDMFSNFSELMNFDTYAGWSNSPSMTAVEGNGLDDEGMSSVVVLFLDAICKKRM